MSLKESIPNPWIAVVWQYCCSSNQRVHSKVPWLPDWHCHWNRTICLHECSVDGWFLYLKAVSRQEVALGSWCASEPSQAAGSHCSEPSELAALSPKQVWSCWWQKRGCDEMQPVETRGAAVSSYWQLLSGLVICVAGLWRVCCSCSLQEKLQTLSSNDGYSVGFWA